MRIFTKTSLRRDIELKILSRYPEIAPNKFDWQIRVRNLLFSRKGYCLVIPIVLGLLSFFTIRMPFLDFIIFEKGTGATIVDQRTSNVATIISMTLAVVGLLLGNLAIKDAKSYRMAFVKSKLYFIIYYTLSVIVCLIIISTLRNTLPEDWFNRLVLAGTYLAVTIPVAIAYLFGTIINFASSDTIMARFKEEYFSEVKAKIYLKLLADYSRDEFLKLMDKHGIKEYKFGWGEQQEDLMSNSNPIKPLKEFLVFDINLLKLEKLLIKNISTSQPFYTVELAINMTTNQHQTYLLPMLKQKNGKNIDLSTCISLVDPSKQLKVNSDFEDYFRDKLEEYLKDNKPKKVKEILDLFDNIYELQMKCL